MPKTLLQKYSTYEEENLGAEAVSATNPTNQTTKKFVRVNAGTSPTTGVALMNANQGLSQVVFNDTGTTLNVNPKPATSDFINAGLTTYTIASGKAAVFICYYPGKWIALTW